MTAKHFPILLIAFSIQIGCFGERLFAQHSNFGTQHSGACAGGCSHETTDALELMPYPYVNGGQQDFRSQRMPQSYRRDTTINDRNVYTGQQDPFRRSYRSAYQGNADQRYDRDNFEMRRREAAYSDNPDASFAIDQHRGHGRCQGGCSHGHGEANYGPRNLPNQPGPDPRQRYDNEADQTPQLNMYGPNRGNPSRPMYPLESGKSF